jgi:hypothetical protein
MLIRQILTIFFVIILFGCKEVGESTEGKISGTSFPNSQINLSVDGELIKTIMADDNGNFETILSGYRNVVVHIDSIGGISNKEILPKTITAKAIINYSPTKENFVSVGVFASMIAGLSRFKIDNDVAEDVAIFQASRTISDFYGINLDEIQYVDDNYNASFSFDRLNTYYLQTGFEYISRQIEEEQQISVLSFGINKLALFVYSDLAHDGIIDGITKTGENYIGEQLIDSNFFTTSLGKSIIEISRVDENLSLGASISLASRITSPNNELFANYEGYVFSEDFTEIRLQPNNNVLTGMAIINVNAFNVNGVKYLSCKMEVFDCVLDEINKTITIDTEKLENGTYSLEITATTIFGDITKKIFEITIFNEVGVFRSINIKDEIISGKFEVGTQFRLDQENISNVEFYIRGKKIFETTSIKEIITYLYDSSIDEDGMAVFKVIIDTIEGNNFSKSVSFKIDNTLPEITDNLSDLPYFDKDELIEATVEDVNKITEINIYWNSLLIEKFTPASHDLVGGKYSYKASTLVDAGTMNEGSHEVSYKAIDESGNVADYSRQVIVDWNPPSAKIVTAGGTYFGQEINIEYQASDSNGLDSIEYAVYRTDGKTLTDSLTGEEIELDYIPSENQALVSYTDKPIIQQSTISINTSSIKHGNYRADITIRDSSGKISSDSIDIIVASAPPVVNFFLLSYGNRRATYAMDIVNQYGTVPVTYAFNSPPDSGEFHQLFDGGISKNETGQDRITIQEYRDSVNCGPDGSRQREVEFDVVITNEYGIVTNYSKGSKTSIMDTYRQCK